MMNANYCNLDEQTLTLLLRSVRANCGLRVLKLVGNNLTGKGTFILSESICHLSAKVTPLLSHLPPFSGSDEVQRKPAGVVSR